MNKHRGFILLETLLTLAITIGILMIAGSAVASTLRLAKAVADDNNRRATLEQARARIANELFAEPSLRGISVRSVWAGGANPPVADPRLSLFEELTRRHRKAPSSPVLIVNRLDHQARFIPTENGAFKNGLPRNTALCRETSDAPKTPLCGLLIASSLGIFFTPLLEFDPFDSNQSDSAGDSQCFEHQFSGTVWGALGVRGITFVYLDESKTLRRIRYPEGQNHPLGREIDGLTAVIGPELALLILKKEGLELELPFRIAPPKGSPLDVWF